MPSNWNYFTSEAPQSLKQSAGRQNRRQDLPPPDDLAGSGIRCDKSDVHKLISIIAIPGRRVFIAQFRVKAPEPEPRIGGVNQVQNPIPAYDGIFPILVYSHPW